MIKLISIRCPETHLSGKSTAHSAAYLEANHYKLLSPARPALPFLSSSFRIKSKKVRNTCAVAFGMTSGRKERFITNHGQPQLRVPALPLEGRDTKASGEHGHLVATAFCTAVPRYLTDGVFLQGCQKDAGRWEGARPQAPRQRYRMKKEKMPLTEPSDPQQPGRGVLGGRVW